MKNLWGGWKKCAGPRDRPVGALRALRCVGGGRRGGGSAQRGALRRLRVVHDDAHGETWSEAKNPVSIEEHPPLIQSMTPVRRGDHVPVALKVANEGKGYPTVALKVAKEGNGYPRY